MNSKDKDQLELRLLDKNAEEESSIESSETFTLEEGLDAIGFGKFQYQLLIVCGIG
jgi:hypothetical protein